MPEVSRFDVCAVVVVDVCPFCLFPVFRFVKTVVLHAAILLGMHLIMQCLVATLLQQACEAPGVQE